MFTILIIIFIDLVQKIRYFYCIFAGSLLWFSRFALIMHNMHEHY